MITKEQLSDFRSMLKGIFALKVNRSTYREVQNAAMNAFDRVEATARDVFEVVLTQKIKKPIIAEENKRLLQSVIEEFSIPLRLAKEVAERGEFISVISSDALPQESNTFFLNRLRRIDGEEFQFLTDMTSTVHLLAHLVDRVAELKSSPAGKQALDKEQASLEKLSERLQNLV